MYKSYNIGVDRLQGNLPVVITVVNVVVNSVVGGVSVVDVVDDSKIKFNIKD